MSDLGELERLFGEGNDFRQYLLVYSSSLKLQDYGVLRISAEDAGYPGFLLIKKQQSDKK